MGRVWGSVDERRRRPVDGGAACQRRRPIVVGLCWSADCRLRLADEGALSWRAHRRPRALRRRRRLRWLPRLSPRASRLASPAAPTTADGGGRARDAMMSDAPGRRPPRESGALPACAVCVGLCVHDDTQVGRTRARSSRSSVRDGDDEVGAPRRAERRACGAATTNRVARGADRCSDELGVPDRLS
jgi:hypothetical protein